MIVNVSLFCENPQDLSESQRESITDKVIDSLKDIKGVQSDQITKIHVTIEANRSHAGFFRSKRVRTDFRDP